MSTPNPNSRRSFLRALIGIPFAAKAIEAIISKGVAKPVPVAPAPQAPWEQGDRWDQHPCFVSGDLRSYWSMTGYRIGPGYTISG